MTRLGIALASLWSRRVAVVLTVVGISLSVAMILGVDRIRLETRESFAKTVAGTDLIVGARTSPVQLLLYSVFQIGDATSNIRYANFQKISRHPMVAWSVPISLGDSHRGFRVVGTTPQFFEHIRHGRDPVRIEQGRSIEDRFDSVIGAEVAEVLGYTPGAEISIAHGTRDDGLARHESLPFTVVGVLTRTGTAVDRSVHITLAAIETIHVGWESGVRIAAQELHGEEAYTRAAEPELITAFYLGLGRRSDVLQVHRAINAFPDEPLLAILPGVALNELWNLFSTAEIALMGVSAMAMFTGLIGMVVGLSATLNERRREMAILRSVGARPRDVFGLFVMESTLIGGLGALGGYLLLSVMILVANPFLGSEFGLQFTTDLPGLREGLMLLLVIGLACLTGMLPAWQAYRLSLQDGLHAGA